MRYLTLPLVAATLISASCAAVPAAYYSADRATYDAVAPAHQRYLLADPALTELERRAALATLELWLARLNANQE
jgi:hypothetical protein